MPWRRRTAQTLDGASRMPIVASSPWILRYPTRDSLSPTGGLSERCPRQRSVDLDGQDRSIAAGRGLDASEAGSAAGQRTSHGRTPKNRLSPASSARSLGRSAGHVTWRRSTATSWRSMTTSIASSSSSRPKSRSNCSHSDERQVRRTAPWPSIVVPSNPMKVQLSQPR